MIRFVIRRFCWAVLLLAVLSGAVFVLQKMSPGDGVKAYLGGNASPDAVAAARHRLGLDRPMLQQYLDYVWRALHGDFGTSMRSRDAVSADLLTFAPATAELVLCAFVIAVALALVFALSGAVRIPGTAWYRGALLVGGCAPPFLVAMVALIVFYRNLDWLPGGGRGQSDGPTNIVLLDSILAADPDQWWSGVQHLILPAATLAIAPALAMGRVLRTSLESTMKADYIRSAQMKGLRPASLLVRYVLRNAVNPALSMAGLQLGFMFAGVVVVEQIFNWAGIGNYLAASIPVDDFPAIAGVTLLLGAIYIVANAVVDILQAMADPRIAL
ncbi:ABC-type transporter, integral membrane subunit [Mycolicibacterium canariasense]|uniref:ABC-type transporter, integral membrane subunit n=1 Tax=Mycolicibacterium canariasense TaxID=228230 RepID=A0A117I964_MYCCR|nr:ABC transporter permease [Mycolicibacterium canariasense]MCV7208871.1 ABC transporter permease [Mycolicibacterium canariasense]ORV07070.1 ABC transporter permease [Mycolicibacterium canariasense]GAS94339.1 ABC-type transporter, integral membrane subunit [Mycolicibacterium canariasense]